MNCDGGREEAAWSAASRHGRSREHAPRPRRAPAAAPPARERRSAREHGTPLRQRASQPTPRQSAVRHRARSRAAGTQRDQAADAELPPASGDEVGRARVGERQCDEKTNEATITTPRTAHDGRRRRCDSGRGDPAAASRISSGQTRRTAPRPTATSSAGPASCGRRRRGSRRHRARAASSRRRARRRRSRAGTLPAASRQRRADVATA